MQKKRYIIVTHKLFPGVGQDLYRYFKSKHIPVLLVEHTFLSASSRRTMFSYYNGKKEKQRVGLDYKFLSSDFICYIKDFIYSLYAALLYPYRYQVYFGCSGFDTIPGLILRLFRRVEKVVFYTIDFIPDRFNNYLLDRLYLFIDRICVRYADQTWNLCKRMIEGREKYNKMPRQKFNRQKTVPVGVWLEDLSDLRNTIAKEKTLIFCGHLEECQGIQLVLESIPVIIEKVSEFKFIIIGEGGYKRTLMNLVKHLKIEKYVEFKGPIYDQKALGKVLCSARVGIAPYKEEGNLRVYFADSTKPKVYLACGLPLIITKVAWIHEEVRNRNMGIVINYNKQELIDAVVKLLSDDIFYMICKRNAEKFILDLDWNRIFDRALKGLENA
ncbi:MAG: hypothetical protein DRP68_02205 [Candidatus Omnitrophota bacterium]|nr:MAG: hypothetical protein DRP68_02205 [Candidatus Omnitrophota bacterium]RKY38794.1 MAG: hypothetical protein DRP72_01150 [Candidatus Omnitrophota bacterium]